MATVIPLLFREPTREVNLTRRTVEMVLDILDSNIRDPSELHLFLSPGGEGWFWVVDRVRPRNNVRAVQWIQRRCPEFWAGAIQGPVLYLSAQEQATMAVDQRVHVMPVPETLDELVAGVKGGPVKRAATTPLAEDPTVSDLFKTSKPSVIDPDAFNEAINSILD